MGRSGWTASFALITPQDRQVPPSREAASSFRTRGPLAPVSLCQPASSLSPAAWPSLGAGRRGRSGPHFPAASPVALGFSAQAGALRAKSESEGGCRDLLRAHPLRVLPSAERAGGPESTGVGEPSPPRSRPRGLCSLSQSLPSAWKYVGLPCPFDRFLIIPCVPPPPRSPPRSPRGFLQSSWAPSHPCTHLLLTASQPAWQ